MTDFLHTIGATIAAAITGIFMLVTGAPPAPPSVPPPVPETVAEQPAIPVPSVSNSLPSVPATGLTERAVDTKLSVLRSDLLLRISQISGGGSPVYITQSGLPAET